MFSAKGYCTESTCFPSLGSSPILVFLCTTHCRHMLCYKHWLSHQTSKIDDNDQHKPKNLLSKFDKQENVSDLLRERTSQEDQLVDEKNDHDENKKIDESKISKNEIEWWNEITPWKNGENFNIKIQESTNDETFSMECNNNNDNSNVKRKRKISKKQIKQSINSRSYAGECPLTFDGAFGLIQKYHQHQLCSSSKNSNKKICLYQHFHSKHGFTGEVSIRLVKAIIHREDPYKKKLFSSTTDTPLTLFDPFHKVKCPLSTRYDIINTPCLTQEITRKSIRRHLLGVHRLDHETTNRLIQEMIK